jgi:DNA modification methylase
MSAAWWVTGNTIDVLRAMPAASVHCIVTSPPYWKKRRYLPAGYPGAANELGQETAPGVYLANLLEVTDELHRVLHDDGVMFVNLGDTAAMSGGAGGDYGAGRWKEHQPVFTGAKAKELLPKSVCWLPELYGASLAYGRNLLTGEPCVQWVTRPPITWCKPNPMVGEIIDKMREATELIVFAAKQPNYAFDLDSVRSPSDYSRPNQKGKGARAAGAQVPGQRPNRSDHTVNENGVPPLNWWVHSTAGYDGAHFAVMPTDLAVIPIKSGCPVDGIVLDPFAGSGTTGAVATGHGRDFVGIDLDGRNEALAAERIGMFLQPVTVPELISVLEAKTPTMGVAS